MNDYVKSEHPGLTVAFGLPVQASFAASVLALLLPWRTSITILGRFYLLRLPRDTAEHSAVGAAVTDYSVD